MPQVMIGLSGKDYTTTTDVWRMAKRALHPAVRRRIGWRGRSSLLREFMLYGFELASQNPENFLRTVRDDHDPLFGRSGRKEAAADRRAALVATWEGYLPAPEKGTRRRKTQG